MIGLVPIGEMARSLGVAVVTAAPMGTVWKAEADAAHRGRTPALRGTDRNGGCREDGPLRAGLVL